MVRHSAGEYANGAFHTNSIEGFWSLLKRQIIGIHHQVSHKYLSRYVDEVAWRFKRSEAGEGNRMNDLIECSTGRLRYRELIA